MSAPDAVSKRAVVGKLRQGFPPRYRKLLLGIVALVLLDQSVKLWVKLSLQPGETIPLLGDLFKLHFLENKGAAFGLTLASLIDMSDISAKILLSLLSVLMCIALAIYLRRIVHYQSRLPVLIALILAGALGNIIDRIYYGVWFAAENDYEGGLFQGRVVDMFYLDIWSGQVADSVPIIGGQFLSLWPVFNFADLYISFGILLVLFGGQHLFAPEGRPAETTANEKQNGSGD